MDHQPYGVQPLTLGDLISRAAAIYRDHFETIVGVAAITLIPAGIFQFLMMVVILRGDDPLASFLLSLLINVVGIAATAAAIAGVTAATAQIVVHGKSSIVGAIDAALPRIVPTLKASFVLYVFLYLISATIIGFPIALYLIVAWAVTLQIVVLEGTGARFSIGRSWELTRNNRFRVLLMMFVVMAITSIAFFLFQLPFIAIIIRVMSSGIWPPAIVWPLVGLFSVVGSFLVTPLTLLAWTLLYFDLRARADGIGAESTANAYEAAPRPMPNMD